MKEIHPEDLAVNNGGQGRPAWVVHNGKVFDLTKSSLWEGGSHMGSHRAGADLTEELKDAPHGPEMLERFEQIGLMTGAAGPPVEGAPAEAPQGLIARFPFLRRHPHPMTVHFPIVFMFSAPVFSLLFLISGIGGFDLAALYCLGAGILFIPVAMMTGYITWHINYGGRPMRPVTIKKTLSTILLCIDAAAFVWRAAEPGILRPFGWAGVIYLAAVISLLPLVIVIGWYGATLTFPLPKARGPRTLG